MQISSQIGRFAGLEHSQLDSGEVYNLLCYLWQDAKAVMRWDPRIFWSKKICLVLDGSPHGWVLWSHMYTNSKKLRSVILTCCYAVLSTDIETLCNTSLTEGQVHQRGKHFAALQWLGFGSHNSPQEKVTKIFCLWTANKTKNLNL